MSIGTVQPRDVGIKECLIANKHITASIAPDALVVCPVNALVDEYRGHLVVHKRFIEVSSLESLFGVPVPCVLT